MTTAGTLPRSNLTVYGMGLKVYGQIESLTKPPKSRRSRSISRPNDRHETTSPLPDGPYKDATSTSRARISSESSTSAANGAAPSRSSSEKVKGFQLFKAPNRSSIDRDMPHADLGSPRRADGSQDGPRKSSGGHSDSHISDPSFDDQVCPSFSLLPQHPSASLTLHTGI